MKQVGQASGLSSAPFRAATKRSGTPHRGPLLPLLLVAARLLALPLCAATTVKVKTNGKILDLTLEQYVAAVVAGESSVFQSKEALQAMAVASRTYAVRLRGRHAAEGYDFCETTHCQRLEPGPTNPRIEEAVAETEGELLWFQGKPAFTPYSRDCGGRTEEGAEPYLSSHPDPYCTRAGQSHWQWLADPKALADALHQSGLRSPSNIERIAIVERTSSGRARTLLLTGAGQSIRVSESSFRFAIGRALGWNTIRSDQFDVSRLLFNGLGAGHGVGLCQRGADEMGRAGRSYRDILAFYYPGTAIGLTGTGLSWQHLSGERLALWTVRPNQDKVVLASAEHLVHDLELRTGWPLPANIQIRVYPDLDTFRNATGEPGSVAAYTQNRRIYLQPVQMLQSHGALTSTLAHELAHVLVSSQARPELPLWFQEGLANYLAGSRATYREATAQVAALANRYGEAAVLGWVKRGLPPDVTNASTSHPATKSK